MDPRSDTDARIDTAKQSIRDLPGYLPALTVFFLIGISQSSIGPLLSFFATRFGASTSQCSLLITGYFAGSLTAMLVISVTRLSGRWFLPLALLLYAVGSGGLFLSGQLEPALACASLNGFGAGALILYINTGFAQRMRAVALINLLNGIFAVGTIVGPLGAGWTISTGHPYGLLAVTLGGLVCYRALRVQDWPEGHGTEAAGPSHAPGRRVSGWNLLTFLLLYTCYGGLETGVGGWAATHLQGQGFSAADAARILAAFWAGTALSKFITLLFAAKVPEGTIVTAGLIGTTAALAMASIPNMGVIGYIATGLALGPVFPTGLAWLAKLGGDRRSIGLTASASMTGSILFPTLIGWSFGKDTGAIPLCLVAIGLCATATAAWIRRSSARPT